MEVIVHSTLSTVGGQVTVATDPHQTVDSLITAFCIQKGIQHTRQLILRNAEQVVLENTRSLQAAGVANADVLFLATRSSDDRWLAGCSQWWVLAAVAMVIGVVGIAAVTVVRINGTVQPDDYGVVIDCGSSHSQVIVYKWPANKRNGTGVVGQVHSCRIDGGISDYESDPAGAGPALRPCLDQAVQKVPAPHQPDTGIYLGATAGMRLIQGSDAATGTNVSDQIMASVRQTLGTYPFNLTEPNKQARVLSGGEEGAFGWVTVNYLTQNFFSILYAAYSRLFVTPGVTYGALDLGGASTQLTFIPADVSASPASSRQSLLLYGTEYDVYSHSYLCYGLNEAWRGLLAVLAHAGGDNTTVMNPCAPAGNVSIATYEDIFELPCTADKPANASMKNTTYTFVGASDADACSAAVRRLFNFTATCPDPPCSFNGVHQPNVYGEFKAFSGFFYTMDFFNLSGNTHSLEEFENATKAYCMKPWEKVLPLGPADRILRYCFQATYVHTLLVDGYRFSKDSWKTLDFVENITINTGKTVDLGWTVGFMLNTSNSVPAEFPYESLGLPVFVLLLLLFILFLLLSIGFACYAKSSGGDERAATYQRLSTYGAV